MNNISLTLAIGVLTAWIAAGLWVLAQVFLG